MRAGGHVSQANGSTWRTPVPLSPDFRWPWPDAKGGIRPALASFINQAPVTLRGRCHESVSAP